jgi:16S rRNA (adenine1518-N6/adenine1519-N6)-dimethyltransferase
MVASGSGEAPGRALRRHGLAPRKRLGQNFLRDRRFLDRILEAAEVGPEDEVLEIGAGTGVLTAALLARARRVVALELDDALYRVLEEEFGAAPNLELWHGNALDFDPCRHFPGSYKLVGNIPYYVTGPIVRHFLESTCRPDVMVLMVQREVAERMTAAPGDLSLLGVSVQFYAQPEIVTRVPAGAFFPRPKVDSAIVRLWPRHTHISEDERRAFFDVARAGFGTKRKTLTNALSTGLGISRAQAEELLARAAIEGGRRAETLSISEWERLAAAWRMREMP